VRAVAGPGGAQPPDASITRYLCAGAYLDAEFARAVIDEVVADPHRGVAPSPGVDVETVARHCIAAARRSVRRDVVIAVILLAIAVVAGLRGVLIVAWFCSIILVFRSLRSLARSDLPGAVSQILIFLLVSAVCAVGLLAQVARQRAGLDGLLGDVDRSGGVPVDSGTLVVLVVLALWVVAFLDRVTTYAVLAETLAPDRFTRAREDFPATSAAEQERLAYVGRAQGSALTVYSPRSGGGRFVGFGAVVHAWTASCRLRAAGLDGDPELDRVGVYSALRDAFASLAGPSGSRPGGSARIVTSDRIVVPGWLPSTHPFVDNPPLRPVAGVPAAVIADIAARAEGTETYYLAVHVPSLTGESAVTGLIHADTAAEVLSVDVALAVLPPVVAGYRSIDAMPPAGGIVLARMLGASAMDVLRIVPAAPVNLARAARRAVTQRVTTLARPSAGRPDDLGARAGVRELGSRSAAAGGAQVFAEDFEVTRAANLISRTVVDAVAARLATGGIDPADFTRTADQVWHKPIDRSADLDRGRMTR
jgi:hypothetical protein